MLAHFQAPVVACQSSTGNPLLQLAVVLCVTNRCGLPPLLAHRVVAPTEKLELKQGEKISIAQNQLQPLLRLRQVGPILTSCPLFLKVPLQPLLVLLRLRTVRRAAGSTSTRQGGHAPRQQPRLSPRPHRPRSSPPKMGAAELHGSICLWSVV